MRIISTKQSHVYFGEDEYLPYQAAPKTPPGFVEQMIIRPVASGVIVTFIGHYFDPFVLDADNKPRKKLFQVDTAVENMSEGPDDPIMAFLSKLNSFEVTDISMKDFMAGEG